jgi:nitrogen fixation protein FixH
MNFELKGWHVLLILLGFFGVTIGVNALFATYALSTFSGEDESKPYLRGLAYNETLAKRAAQAVLNWQATIEIAREGENDALVSVSIMAGDGTPLSALEVEATLRRPVDARRDRTVRLEAVGDGAYRGRVADVERGQWDVVARAAAAGGAAFEAERRVMLK